MVIEIKCTCAYLFLYHLVEKEQIGTIKKSRIQSLNISRIQFPHLWNASAVAIADLEQWLVELF